MALDYRSSLLHYRKYLQVVQKKPIWRETLFVTLSLILLIILVVFALRPTLVTIASLTGEIQSKREIEARLNSKIANLQTLVQSYQKIQPQIYLLDTALPIQPKFSNLGEYLQSSASASAVQVDTFNLGNINLATNSPPTQGLTDIEFSLGVKGGYIQIHDFLYRLENSRRLITVDSLQITRNQTGSLVANIKGRAFFILENYSP